MIKKLVLSILCALTMQSPLLFAESQATDTVNPATSAVTTTKMDDKKNGNYIAMIEAVDKAEIAAANIALTKKPSANIKAYAEMMIKDHTQNLKDTMALSKTMHLKPVKNAEIKAMIKDNQKLGAMLKATKDVDFPKAYIDAMVDGHTKVLAKIDAILANPTSLGPQLEEHLKTTREAVAKHLTDAQTIQKEMDNTVSS